jgi:hypothetical protein
VGSGSFVALVFAACLFLILNIRQSIIIGALTVVLALPYLAALREPAQNVGGGSLIQLTIRHFSPIPLSAAAYLLLLPLNYLMELGFFAACVWIGYRRRTLKRHEWALLTMALISILTCTFLKSGATPNNDLGWRGFLVAQFALLILSTAYVERVQLTRFLRVLLILGLLGTGYDLLLTRFFPLLSDASQVPKLAWLARDTRLGERTFAHRAAYVWLSDHSGQTAVIGQNPDVLSLDIFYGLYADRPTVAGDRSCTVGFGGTPSACAPIEAQLSSLFAGKGDFAAVCQSLPAKFYLASDTDPVWNQPKSWVWMEKPVFKNEFVRMFACKRSNWSQ